MGMKCVRLSFLTLVLLVSTLSVLVMVPHLTLKPISNFVDKKMSKILYNRVDTYDPQRSQGPDLTVRSVYFDGRQRYGYHNACVFMIEVRKHYLYFGAQLITGCLVGTTITTQFKIHPIYINGKNGKIVDEKPSLTHAMAMVDCFDVPAVNGSNASLVYRTHKGGFSIPAISQQPLFIPPAHKTTTPNRIAACIAVVYGRPSFLEDWIQYQHETGLDHIHMISDISFVENGGLKSPHVKAALDSGFLSVAVWKTQLKTNTEIHYHSQMLAYQDCVYRHIVTYDYLLLTDQDDFFVPLVKDEPTLHYYSKRWCPEGACLFDWIEFYPDCGLMQGTGYPPGNVTSRLKSRASKRVPFKKSLYRLQDTVEVGIHDPREMMPGTGGVAVPISQAYVAHIRKGRYPTHSQC